MRKKVLVLSTSLRRRSTSAALANAFADGAREAGHDAEEVSLVGKRVGFCNGCLTCRRTGKCVLVDDANEVVSRMGQAEVLAFATPVYHRGLSGQLKTLLDRSAPLFEAGHAFRDVYLLAAAAEGEDDAVYRPYLSVVDWAASFEKARVAGVVLGKGPASAGDVVVDEAALARARELGAGV